ncbi:hypothetical protein [Parvicella tangerina]|uniref:Lipoprotein n=1 Tax=Parvicella tangerina TaxID=2829795 RepID=A0A916JNR5_9FLAO|nr:hypothetical protein [Parvicella tangerina]CAG5082574.1 hypothetical protein CRYO30217_01955 [Parvicella tangerina]
MRLTLLIFIIGLLASCGSEKSETNNRSGDDEIIECFKEVFEQQGLNYHEHLSETIQTMNQMGFPIKSGKAESLIEVLKKMKERSFPTNVNIESEAIYKRLSIESLAACVFEFQHVDEMSFKTAQKFDEIAVYEVHTQEQFNQMTDDVIAKLLSLSPLPDWADPFNVHMATLFYTQYWRINHTENDSFFDDADSLENYSPPTPPITPPPPPPAPIEVEEIENEYEEDIQINLPDHK